MSCRRRGLDEERLDILLRTLPDESFTARAAYQKLRQRKDRTNSAWWNLNRVITGLTVLAAKGLVASSSRSYPKRWRRTT